MKKQKLVSCFLPLRRFLTLFLPAPEVWFLVSSRSQGFGFLFRPAYTMGTMSLEKVAWAKEENEVVRDMVIRHGVGR
jgi:hypothetical protein